MLWEKFKKFINQHQLIHPHDSILVSVSGGVDSMCLLHALIRLSKHIPFSLAIVHFNHGLRGKESLKDALFVVRQAARYCVPCHSMQIPVSETAKKEKKGIEETARMLRYQHLADLVIAYGFTKVALGHHLDDQAETVLFRLIRGSGMNGLAGIYPKRILEGTKSFIIRPFLDVKKNEIIRYARRQKIRFRTDHTNFLNTFMRNKIRSTLVPLLQKFNPQSIEHCSRLAVIVRENEEYWNDVIRKYVDNTVRKENGKLFLDLRKFNEYHITIRKRILLYILLEHTEYAVIDGLIQWCSSAQSGKKYIIPGGGRVQKLYDTAIIDFHASTFSSQFFHRLHVPGETRVPERLFTPTPLQKATAVKPWMNAGILLAKRETDKATPVKVWGFTICTNILTQRPGNVRSGKTRAYIDYDVLKGKSWYIRCRKTGDRFYPFGMQKLVSLKKYFINQHIPVSERNVIPIVCAGEYIVWVVGSRIDDRWKITEKTKKILEISIEK